MRIESLQVDRLYGHLTFSLSFNADINFLTGINGTGKTTALNVLFWVLSPASLSSFRHLAQLQFNLINIGYSFINDSGDREFGVISARRDSQHVRISMEGVKGDLKIPIIQISQESLPLEKSERTSTPDDLYQRLYETFTVEHKDNPVFKGISKLSRPLFLPLDRRFDEQSDSSAHSPYLRLPKKSPFFCLPSQPFA